MHLIKKKISRIFSYLFIYKFIIYLFIYLLKKTQKRRDSFCFISLNDNQDQSINNLLYRRFLITQFWAYF